MVEIKIRQWIIFGEEDNHGSNLLRDAFLTNQTFYCEKREKFNYNSRTNPNKSKLTNRNITLTIFFIDKSFNLGHFPRYHKKFARIRQVPHVTCKYSKQTLFFFRLL